MYHGSAARPAEKSARDGIIGISKREGAEAMEIRRISQVMKETYGTKVYRLSLDAGCGCPNRDGRGRGGCIFCSAGGSGDFAGGSPADRGRDTEPAPLEEQIRQAKKLVSGKMKSVREEDRKYIAYFQAYTSTYGEPERLREIFLKTIRREEIVVLAIGTRPDCLGPEILEILTELNRIKPVWIELGLQTIHEETARRIHRGYGLPVFADAYRRLKEAGLTVIVHVILGLPGESGEDMLDTVRYLAGLTPTLDGIKLQLLHVLKGTELGRQYEEHPFPLLDLDTYVELVVSCLKLLPAETVVHRLTGDGPKRLLLGPLWSADKKRVLNRLNQAIARA